MADVIIESKKRNLGSGVKDLETEFTHMHPLVSWRSIVGGLLVAFLTLSILLSLGMAFGGIGLSDGASMQSAGVFTGVWFLVSALTALFAGSYFAARISKFHTNRIGSAQGLVIAALFFGLFVWQTAKTIGWVGGTATSAVSGAASGVGQVSSNPVVNDVIEDAIGDMSLQADPKTVASGVASRLLRGDTEGAKNYLARMSGTTPAEADRRIAEMRTRADETMANAREATASALQATGWTLFATLLLGTAAAIGGGALGSRANIRKPLTREQAEAVHQYAPV